MDSPPEVEISDNLSAARCRVYVRKDLKVLLYYIILYYILMSYIYFLGELIFKTKVGNAKL